MRRRKHVRRRRCSADSEVSTAFQVTALVVGALLSALPPTSSILLCFAFYTAHATSALILYSCTFAVLLQCLHKIP